MKTNSSCCAETQCETTIVELPRYYPRQLITPDDLTLEQNYFRDRMRRHNRLMHGWGVVCGAVVCPVTDTAPDGTISFVPWKVKVGNGYVLGPYGDEIIIDCERTLDVRTSGISGVSGETCIDMPDPWCTPVFTPPTEATKLFIAVKYKQCKTRPVRVQPAGCGCDDTACEYSRWRDGYEIGVLQECPPCNTQPAPFDPCARPPRLDLQSMCRIPECPDCACGPWVGLAVVTIEVDGAITIDNCSCRRMAVSLSQLWWICGGSLTNIDVPGKPKQVKAGGAPVVVTVTGTNLSTRAIYSFGDDISVRNPVETPNRPSGTSIDLTVSASATTKEPMVRPLKVVNYPDCSWGAVPDAIAIAPPDTTVVPGTAIAGGTVNQSVVAPRPRPKAATKARASRKSKK